MDENFYACRFIETNGTWKITGNFCFNETDGPFPERLAPLQIK